MDDWESQVNSLFDPPQAPQAQPVQQTSPQAAPSTEQPPSQSELAKQAVEHLPDVDHGWQDQVNALFDPNYQDKQLAFHREEAKDRPENWAETIAANVMPFSPRALIMDQAYKQAKARFDQGIAGDSDAREIAEYEHQSQLESQRGTAGKLGAVASKIPAMIGEAATAGKFIPVGKSVLGFIGGKLAQTPLMPSLYAEEASKRSVEQGGDVLSPQNIAPAMAMGAIKNVILGSAGKLTSGIANPVGRFAAGVGVGKAEIEATEALGGVADEFLPEAYQTHTRYGLMGDIKNGRLGEAAQKAVVDVLTVAAFQAMHGNHYEAKKTVQDAVKTFDDHANQGSPVDAAAGAVQKGIDSVKQTVEAAGKDPTLDVVKGLTGNDLRAKPPAPPPEWIQPSEALKSEAADVAQGRAQEAARIAKQQEAQGPTPGIDELSGQNGQGQPRSFAEVTALPVKEAIGLNDHEFGQWTKSRYTDSIGGRTDVLSQMVELRDALRARNNDPRALKKVEDAITYSRALEDPAEIRKRYPDFTEEEVAKRAADGKEFNVALDKAQEPPKTVAPSPPTPSTGQTGPEAAQHPVGKAFADVFPGAKQTSPPDDPVTRWKAEFGKHEIYARHDPETNSVIISFGWQEGKEPEGVDKNGPKANVPREMQPGSKEMYSKLLTGFAGKLRDQGVGIEYTATDSRAPTYSRRMKKAGFEQASEPKEVAPNAGSSVYSWKPAETPAPSAPYRSNPLRDMSVVRAKLKQALVMSNAEGYDPAKFKAGYDSLLKAKGDIVADAWLDDRIKTLRQERVDREAQAQADAVREAGVQRQTSDQSKAAIKSMMSNAGLSDIEQHVLVERLVGDHRQHADIANDEIAQDYKGGRSTIKAIEKRALKKIGYKGSIEDLWKEAGDDMEGRLREVLPNIEPGDLASDPNGVARKFDVAVDAEDVRNTRWQKYIKELKDNAGQYTAGQLTGLDAELSARYAKGQHPPGYAKPTKLGSPTEREADLPPSLRPGNAGELPQNPQQRLAPTPENATVGNQGGQGEPTTAAAGNAEAAGNQLDLSKLSSIERAQFMNPNTSEYLKQNLLRRAAGARSLYDEVRANGINPNSDVFQGAGKEEWYGNKDAKLPKSLFRKGGSNLDELADQYGTTEEGFLQMLHEHHLLDAGAWYTEEAARQESDYYANRDEIHEQIAKDNPQVGSSAEAERLVPEIIQAGQEAGARESRDLGAAESLDRTIGEGEPGRSGADVSAEPQSISPPGNPAAAVQAGNGSPLVPFNNQFRREPGTNEPITGGREFGAAVKDFVGGESGSVDLDKLKATTEKIAEKVKGIADNLAELSGRMYPRTSRQSEAAANSMARYISVNTYAHEAAPYYIDQVLGPKATPAEDHLYGTAFQEMRHRVAKERVRQEQYKAEAQALEARRVGDSEKAGELTKRAVALKEQANDIITFVGQDNSPLKTEADYRAALTKLPEILKRFQADVVPIMEANFRSAQGMEETDPIDSLTQIPGLPMNAKPIQPGEESDSTVYIGGGRGNLKNAKQGKIPFANKATLSGEAYDTRFSSIIENTLAKGSLAARKAEMNRTMVAEGVAKWGVPGAKGDPIGREALSGYDEYPNVNPPKGSQEATAGQTSLYVKNNGVKYSGPSGEYYKALDLGRKQEIPGLTPLMNYVNKSAFMTTVEGTYHTATMSKALTAAGVSPVDVIKNAYKEMTGDKAFQKQLVDLAYIGAQKDSDQRPYSNLNPFKWTASFLHSVNDVMRVTLSQAHDRLVAKGDLPDTEASKRDWINTKLGQYNKRGQNDMVVLARDLGIGPFATIGTQNVLGGIRSLYGGPGVEATSATSAAKLRAASLGRVAILLGGAAALNAVIWGRADGDDNTPWGSIKVYDDGKGKSMYIDPLGAFSGVRRGLRMTGLTAISQGIQKGQPAGSIADNAFKDAVSSVVRPFTGPAYEFGHTVMTGKNALDQQVAEHADYGESQYAKNFKAAVWNLNPNIAQITGKNLAPGQEASGLERATAALAPFAKWARDKQPDEVSNLYEALHKGLDVQRDAASAARKTGVKAKQPPDLGVLNAAAMRVTDLERKYNTPGLDQGTKQRIREAQKQIAKSAMERHDAIRQTVPTK